MLLAEPPPSPYDLRFSIFGIPVRIHPYFWLVGVFLGYNAGSLVGVLIWIAALFVAILVHELGHALVMRHFGLRPWITLHGMGGLASYDPRQMSYSRANTWIRQILIDVAGVCAGFLLALAVIGACLAFGCTFILFVGSGTGLAVQLSAHVPCYVGVVHGVSITGLHVTLDGIPVPVLSQLLNSLLWICFIWGLVNLLPIYPLDGGQISREVFLRFSSLSGIRNSLILSMLTAGSVAAYSLAQVLREAQLLKEAGQSPGGAFRGASLFVPLLFGYLAYTSYATLQAYRDRRGRW
jgi:membrane-associated protease RseP (regulator of RpoE activity)